MSSLVALIRIPGVLRITASQLFARFPLGMLSIAVLLQVRQQTGSYALAGFVVASVSVGEAVAVPLTSRLLGVAGIRRTILVTAVVCGGALAVLGMRDIGVAAYAAAGLVAGATVPPIMPAIRALYPRLVDEGTVPALFALDTTAQELIWIAGPVLATVLATMVNPSVPLFLAAGITVVGGAWFVSAPQLASFRVAPSSARFGRVLGNGAVGLAMAASGALVASYAALEIAIVSHLAGQGALAGVAIAISSTGSLVGGLTLGRRGGGLLGLAALLAGVAVATALSAWAEPLGLFLVLLFLAGFGFAPAVSNLYLTVSRSLDESAAPEAFGWLNTAALVGGALGTALAGVAGDRVGPQGAFLAATLLAVVAAACPAVVLVARRLPGREPD